MRDTELIVCDIHGISHLLYTLSLDEGDEKQQALMFLSGHLDSIAKELEEHEGLE